MPSDLTLLLWRKPEAIFVGEFTSYSC